MKRIIHYYQMIPIYDDEGNQTGTQKSPPMAVESYNDHDFNEQLMAVKGYCGDDYTVIIEPETPTIDERLSAVEAAILEIAEVL